MMEVVIGKNLRRVRKERGVNQVAVAEAVGVRQTHISSIESGDKNPSLAIAIRIANFLGVSLDELVRTEQEEREVVA